MGFISKGRYVLNLTEINRLSVVLSKCVLSVVLSKYVLSKYILLIVLSKVSTVLSKYVLSTVQLCSAKVCSVNHSVKVWISKGRCVLNLPKINDTT